MATNITSQTLQHFLAIELSELRRHYQDVMPQLEGMLQANPQGMERRFKLFEKRLATKR